MAKILKLVANILFVITIILLITYFAFRVTDKIEIYRVKTGSMEEKIHAGDYILIYRKKSYNVGEVVTYTSNDGFITHRIIRKEGGKIITKGDANNTEDNEIVASTIVGKVIISGGILNIVITYKYVIACALLSLYLFSCYYGKGEKDELSEELGSSEIKMEEKKEEVEEKKTEEKDETVETKEEKVETDEKNDEEIKKEEEKQDETEEKEETVEVKEETLTEEKKEEVNVEKKDDDVKKEEVVIKKKTEKKK